MAGRLSGDVAIVTGAARGIGYAIAKRLGEEGAEVMIADVREAVHESGEALREEGIAADTIECDVTDTEDAVRLADETADRLGGIDVLVNNAGISMHRTFTELTPEEWNDVIGVNLTGVFNCSHAVVPEMLDGDGGRVVNISSMAGRSISYHAAPNYTASKWGVIGLTKHMAWDLGPDVRVNAVCPGSTLTDMTKTRTTEEERAETTRKIPLGRWARPEDHANGVLYLVSEEASYLTGTVLEIDGGKQLGVRHDV